MTIDVPSKDPNNIEPYHFVWCSRDGTNANTAADTGELKGATISSYAVSVVTGTIVIDSNHKNAITIRGVAYPADTVVTVWVSGGTHNEDCDILCRIVTSDNRTLDQTLRVPIRTN